jgi:hypothetical protein
VKKKRKKASNALILYTVLAIKLTFETTAAMAQTANKKKQQPAIDRYNKLSLVKQRLTWLYYHDERTNNQEGLSPEGVVGGINDWDIAGTVKQYIPVDRFSYQAKVR